VFLLTHWSGCCSRDVQRAGDARGVPRSWNFVVVCLDSSSKNGIVCPLLNSIFKKCDKSKHLKCVKSSFDKKQVSITWIFKCKMCTIKALPQVKIKKLHESGITLRNNRHLIVVTRTWNGAGFCMALLARKKWSTFQNVPWRSAKTTIRVEMYRGAESVNSFDRCSFLTTLLYYFDI